MRVRACRGGATRAEEEEIEQAVHLIRRSVREYRLCPPTHAGLVSELRRCVGVGVGVGVNVGVGVVVSERGGEGEEGGKGGV